MKTRLTVLLALIQLLPAFGEEAPHNGHELAEAKAGTYRVGQAGHYFNPRREVRLAAFRIATTETTNAQFARFVAATGYKTDAEKRGFGRVAKEGFIDWAWKEIDGAHWRLPQGPGGPKAEDLPGHPVTQISGADAAAYCRWAGGRLPTIEEWEVAARAGAETLYPWGPDWDDAKANIWNGRNHRKNTRKDGWVYTSPVKSYPPNAWGLHDVVGNVFEYCEGLPAKVPASEKSRLIAGRGGSWWCSASTCSFYNLVDVGTQDRHGSLSNQGFRIVFDAE